MDWVDATTPLLVPTSNKLPLWKEGFEPFPSTIGFSVHRTIHLVVHAIVGLSRTPVARTLALLIDSFKLVAAHRRIHLVVPASVGLFGTPVTRPHIGTADRLFQAHCKTARRLVQTD
ncbi:hypothetical protein Tco_0735399 [Tanacetum coccineum]